MTPRPGDVKGAVYGTGKVPLHSPPKIAQVRKRPTKMQTLAMGLSLDKHLKHALLVHIREQVGFEDVVEVFDWGEEPEAHRVRVFCDFALPSGGTGAKAYFWPGTTETLLRHLIAKGL